MCAEILEEREEMPEKRHMRGRGCVTTEQIKCAGMTQAFEFTHRAASGCL